MVPLERPHKSKTFILTSAQQWVTCPTQLLKARKEQKGFLFHLSPAEKLIKTAVLHFTGWLAPELVQKSMTATCTESNLQAPGINMGFINKTGSGIRHKASHYLGEAGARLR